MFVEKLRDEAKKQLEAEVGRKNKLESSVGFFEGFIVKVVIENLDPGGDSHNPTVENALNHLDWNTEIFEPDLTLIQKNIDRLKAICEMSDKELMDLIKQHSQP